MYVEKHNKYPEYLPVETQLSWISSCGKNNKYPQYLLVGKHNKYPGYLPVEKTTNILDISCGKKQQISSISFGGKIEKVENTILDISCGKEQVPQ